MLSIIVAVSQNGAIGKDNKLLWHIPNDLKRFKSITSGHTIIMGRKTFESLPKVLPNRHHIVITRDKNFKVNNESVEVINSIDDVISRYKDSPEEVFIIGGGDIYRKLLPYANKIYMTKIYKVFNGDTYFTINKHQWNIINSSEVLKDGDIRYQFIDLVSRK